MSQPPFIKPGQLDGLPYLTDEKKGYYKNGLAALWQTYESNPQGSAARTTAENKIRAASIKIMSELSVYQTRARPQSGGGPNQRPPPQGAMSGQQVPQQQQQQQQQQQGGGPGQGQGQPQQDGQASQQFSPAVRQQLQGITVNIPSNIAPSTHAAYRQKWMQAAATYLQQRESALAKGKQATANMNSFTKAGQPVPEQLTATLESAKRSMNDAINKFQAMRTNNDNVGRQMQQAAQQGNGNQGQAGQQQQQVNGAGGQEMQRSNTFQGNNAEIKTESRTSMSPPQQHGSFQQQQAQQSAPAQNAPNMNQQQVQQTPQTATQPQPPQNFPQQPQQQQQQQYPNQQRPQVNQQLSQSQIPQQHQQTPASAIPTSAQQPQRPQALSQQAAMEQAAQSYSRQQQMPNQGSQSNVPQVPNGLPFNAPPSASQPTPTSGFPHQAPSLQATTTPNHKFPISKTLQLDPRTQQPAQGPPSRPTYGAQGMMSQPAYQRQPPFTLEGDGDRVLSKRKLDELVRQVTGTTSTSTTDEQSSSSFLSPEVEESMLTMCDDFVDDVITGACRLAKLRPGATLDIRDIQMVLERNYGIRVPGYTLEEVRTVRKFQPSQGWQTKMGAVQTAKTLGGVGVGGKADS